ncbi:hypothetical protein JCM4914_49470 [Streptomyces platensis subsp. malvinus]
MAPPRSSPPTRLTPAPSGAHTPLARARAFPLLARTSPRARPYAPRPSPTSPALTQTPPPSPTHPPLTQTPPGPPPPPVRPP